MVDPEVLFRRSYFPLSMKKFRPLSIILFLVLFAEWSAYSQESESQEFEQPTKTTVSCLGLQNPKSESEMDEFRDCIKRFNEERRAIMKFEKMQRILVASEELTNLITKRMEKLAGRP